MLKGKSANMSCYNDAELLNVSIRRIRLFSRILLNKEIDVNSIYNVNRRICLILTFKSSCMSVNGKEILI